MWQIPSDLTKTDHIKAMAQKKKVIRREYPFNDKVRELTKKFLDKNDIYRDVLDQDEEAVVKELLRETESNVDDLIF